MHNPSHYHVTQIAQYYCYHTIYLYEPRTYDYREKNIIFGMSSSPNPNPTGALDI
jgi:hypothetical protein